MIYQHQSHFLNADFPPYYFQRRLDAAAAPTSQWVLKKCKCVENLYFLFCLFESLSLCVPSTLQRESLRKKIILKGWVGFQEKYQHIMPHRLWSTLRRSIRGWRPGEGDKLYTTCGNKTPIRELLLIRNRCRNAVINISSSFSRGCARKYQIISSCSLSCIRYFVF